MDKAVMRIRTSDLIPAVVLSGLILLAITLCIVDKYHEGEDWLVYQESLDKVAAYVDGQELTLRDMAFYIAYDETVVEEQAELYDPENTKRYWNLKTNNTFIRQISKDNVMKKAIHDEIFYAMAVSEGIELTESDEARIKDAQDMFWDNIMYGDKLERLGVTAEDLNRTIRKISVAQKYQAVYAGLYQMDMEELEIEGEGYGMMLESHKCRVYSRVWDKVNYGEITLSHTKGIF